MMLEQLVPVLVAGDGTCRPVSCPASLPLTLDLCDAAFWRSHLQFATLHAPCPLSHLARARAATASAARFGVRCLSASAHVGVTARLASADTQRRAGQHTLSDAHMRLLLKATCFVAVDTLRRPL